MAHLRLLFALLCCFLLLSLTACNDDDDCPTCPTGAAPHATMANIWPHADGNSWIFEMAYKEYSDPAAFVALGDTSNLPDPPTMATLHAELQEPLPGTPSYTASAIFRFAFNGEVVTESGVTAQQVEETLFLEGSANKSGRTVLIQNASQRLLRLVAQGRPDLRDAILPFMDTNSKDLEDVSGHMFLGGYAFAAEDTGYFGYGDIDANHSWVYLGSSLEVGTEFSIQLLPAFTDDIWLYGRIWSQGNLTVGSRQFENVVECMYLVDFGQQDIIDEEGNLVGTFNPYLYGTTHFAPEVGPIKGLERNRLAPVPNPMGDGYPSTIDYVLDLVGGNQAH